MEDAGEDFGDYGWDGVGIVAGGKLGAGVGWRGGPLQGNDGEREGYIRAGGTCGAREGGRRAGGEFAGLFWERAAEAGRSIFADKDRQSADGVIFHLWRGSGRHLGGARPGFSGGLETRSGRGLG